MSVHVLGLALHRPADRIDDLRLEEMVYHTARAALDDAGVTRGRLDSVTLGACDELDGRSISSMLMAMPAGAYLTDEIKVTDSAATALCLATARLLTGEFHLCMVASWCKSSKTDVEAIMRLRGEPFYTRPLGLNMTHGAGVDKLAASQQGTQITGSRGRGGLGYRLLPAGRRTPPGHELRPHCLELRVPAGRRRAAARRCGGTRRHRSTARDGRGATGWLPMPTPRLRPSSAPAYSCRGGCARHARCLPPSGSRLPPAQCRTARPRPGRTGRPTSIEAQTGWHEAAYVRTFAVADAAVSPSGGPFSQNPLFCTGLVGAAEAVLQVANRAGPVQVAGVRRAAAHSCHGYAQQGNVVMVFDAEAQHA